jgi:hypothetical protein
LTDNNQRPQIRPQTRPETRTRNTRRDGPRPLTPGVKRVATAERTRRAQKATRDESTYRPSAAARFARELAQSVAAALAVVALGLGWFTWSSSVQIGSDPRELWSARSDAAILGQANPRQADARQKNVVRASRAGPVSVEGVTWARWTDRQSEWPEVDGIGRESSASLGGSGAHVADGADLVADRRLQRSPYELLARH